MYTQLKSSLQPTLFRLDDTFLLPFKVDRSVPRKLPSNLKSIVFSSQNSKNPENNSNIYASVHYKAMMAFSVRVKATKRWNRNTTRTYKLSRVLRGTNVSTHYCLLFSTENQSSSAEAGHTLLQAIN